VIIERVIGCLLTPRRSFGREETRVTCYVDFGPIAVAGDDEPSEP